MKFYFSKDGKTQYGEKYSHLADVTIELTEPEEREGYIAKPAYNPTTKTGYWEYIEIKLSPEEELEQLKQQIIAQQTAINALLGV